MDNQAYDLRLDFFYFDEKLDCISTIVVSSQFFGYESEAADAYDLNSISTIVDRVEKALKMAGCRFDDFTYTTASHNGDGSTESYNVTLIKSSAVQSA